MKGIIKFNGKLYAPLEEGAYSIQGKIVEVVESKPVEEGEVEWPTHKAGCPYAAIRVGTVGCVCSSPVKSEEKKWPCCGETKVPVHETKPGSGVYVGGVHFCGGSEEKCEHDKGDHWEKDKKTKLTKFTSTASGNAELCPFCHKPEERKSSDKVTCFYSSEDKGMIAKWRSLSGFGENTGTAYYELCVALAGVIEILEAERNRGGGK